jgi:hypothetical protein
MLYSWEAEESRESRAWLPAANSADEDGGLLGSKTGADPDKLVLALLWFDEADASS